MGSFVSPTINLLAICHYHSWSLQILPFANSSSEAFLKRNLALGDKIDPGWGSGFQDASHRSGYDPVQLNANVYDALGIFPNISAIHHSWIKMERAPKPDQIATVCQSRTSNDTCYLQVANDPRLMNDYMREDDYDAYFAPEFRTKLYNLYMQHNRHRPVHFSETTSDFHIAVHVRRGDILSPGRWLNQAVYAQVVRRLCACHNETATHVHVFSAGPNRDGNWSTLEQLEKEGCDRVSFHLDQHEYDTWAHMVVADALVMSISSFSVVPALLRVKDNVYFPHTFWQPRLSSWHAFDSHTGELVNKTSFEVIKAQERSIT